MCTLSIYRSLLIGGAFLPGVFDLEKIGACIEITTRMDECSWSSSSFVISTFVCVLDKLLCITW